MKAKYKNGKVGGGVVALHPTTTPVGIGPSTGPVILNETLLKVKGSKSRTQKKQLVKNSVAIREIVALGWRNNPRYVADCVFLAVYVLLTAFRHLFE